MINIPFTGQSKRGVFFFYFLHKTLLIRRGKPSPAVALRRALPRHHVSIGYCAQIAEMTEEDFIKFLGQNKVSIFQFDDTKEFLEEMNNA